MDRSGSFSYLCNRCGRCCHDKVITLSPYDVIRIARAAGISTREAITRYTLRRGSLLKFETTGECTALEGMTCTIHEGRPLACRLYPLELQRLDNGPGVEEYYLLEPAVGSLGHYGTYGTVAEYLTAQGTDQYLLANRRYASLLALMRRRIAELTDFEVVEPREFWRIAVREALAETNFDDNSIVEALFDPDTVGGVGGSEFDTVEQHLREMRSRIHQQTDSAVLAAAAVMLAVSLGYSPGEVIFNGNPDSRSSE